MQELLSLLGELKTLAAVATNAGLDVPPQVSSAIDKVMAELSAATPVAARVLADVKDLVSDVKSSTSGEVQIFAGQVLQLVDNIQAVITPAPSFTASKPLEAPAS